MLHVLNSIRAYQKPIDLTKIRNFLLCNISGRSYLVKAWITITSGQHIITFLTKLLVLTLTRAKKSHAHQLSPYWHGCHSIDSLNCQIANHIILQSYRNRMMWPMHNWAQYFCVHILSNKMQIHSFETVWNWNFVIKMLTVRVWIVSFVLITATICFSHAKAPTKYKCGDHVCKSMYHININTLSPLSEVFFYIFLKFFFVSYFIQK